MMAITWIEIKIETSEGIKKDVFVDVFSAIMWLKMNETKKRGIDKIE